jgi:hypothetical protein
MVYLKVCMNYQNASFYTLFFRFGALHTLPKGGETFFRTFYPQPQNYAAYTAGLNAYIINHNNYFSRTPPQTGNPGFASSLELF